MSVPLNDLPIIDRNEQPVVVTVGGNQSLLSRVTGGIVGNIIGGVVVSLIKHSMWIYVPIACAAVAGWWGWKVEAPEGVRKAGHGVMERFEKLADGTAVKLKEKREAWEEFEAKAKLEIERAAVKTREEKDVLAKQIADIELKGKQEKEELTRQVKELKEKADAAKNSLAGKVVGKVVENRVDAAKSGLVGILPSWGKSEPKEEEPPPDPNKTMVRLRSAKFPVPNAKCQYCSALLVVGEIKAHTPDGKPTPFNNGKEIYDHSRGYSVISFPIVDDVLCPQCKENISPTHAQFTYSMERERNQPEPTYTRRRR